MSGSLCSVVVSVYNEEAALPLFYAALLPAVEALKWDYEILFVDDGSTDRSAQLLSSLAAQNPRVRVITFARNYGHEAAMIAGIDYARGDAVVCMDADLQHPPALLGRILEAFEDGYEVVNMVRTRNESAGKVKNLTSRLFYRMLNALSDIHFENNASDFFAISANVAQIMRRDFRERARFLRGYIQCVGFRRTTIAYAAEPRAAGKSKYSLRGLMRFSVAALVSFSEFPLRLGIFTGIFAALIGLAVMIYTIVTKILYDAPSGYSTIIVVMCFMFALLFCLLGIIGEYIAVLFREVKGRPIYIVQKTVNVENSSDLQEG